MDWLKEWVRELVMLVLLAGCLELLVPMNGLKRYVRMVMGLLVVVTVLNPVLALWDAKVTVDANFLHEANARLPSITQVKAAAAEYRQRSQSLVAEEFKRRIEVQAAQAARAVAGVAAARAEADVEMGSGQPQVTRLQVWVTPGRAGAVRPVEPVRIGSKTDERPVSGARHPLADTVREKVAGGLGVEPARVLVMLKEEP